MQRGSPRACAPEKAPPPWQDPAAERLAGVLKDPHGLDFAVGFVDGVARPAGPLRGRLQPAARRAGASRASFPGTCGWRSGSAACSVPCCRGWSSRSPAGCCARWSGTSSSTPPPTKLGPAIAQLRAPGDPQGHGAGSTSTCSARPCSARRRRCAGSRARVRCSPRDDVDYVSIKVSSIASASSRCGRSTRPSTGSSSGCTPLYELAAASPTAKFINLDMEEYRDLDLTDRGLHAASSSSRSCSRTWRRASCCRPTCPTRSGRCSGSPRGRRAARAGGGAPHQGAARQGREPRDGAGGCDDPRLAARDLRDASRRPTPTTSGCSTGRCTREHTDAVTHRRRRPQPLRCRLRLAARSASAGVDGPDRLRDAARHGDRAGRGRASDGRAGCCSTRRSSTRREFDVAISLPHPPAGGEREPGELHVGGVRARTRAPGCSSARSERFLALGRRARGGPGAAWTLPPPNRQQDRTREWEEPRTEPLTRPAAEPLVADQRLTERRARAREGLDECRPRADRGSSAARRSALGAGDATSSNAADTDPSLAANRAWGRQILARSQTSQLGATTIAAAR